MLRQDIAFPVFLSVDGGWLRVLPKVPSSWSFETRLYLKLKGEERVFVSKFDVQLVTVHTSRPAFLVFGSSSILNVLVVWSWREDRWLDFDGSVGCTHASYCLLLECKG